MPPKGTPLFAKTGDPLNDFDLSDFDTKKSQFPGDERLMVTFYMGAVLDVKATEQAIAAQVEADLTETEYTGPVGKIFKDVPFIRIEIPGDKLNINEREANEFDMKVRFKDRYAKFVAGQSQDNGTPIALLPGSTRGQTETLLAQNVRTIEQLASLDDSHAGRIMGGIGLKRRASAYLDSLSEQAAAAREAKVEEALKMADTLASQAKMIEELQRKLAAKD